MIKKPRLRFHPARELPWYFEFGGGATVSPFRDIAAAMNFAQSSSYATLARSNASIAQPSDIERADAATNPQRSRDPRLLDEQSPPRHLQQ